eukprot:3111509-Pyramimonas_sp.AAC.1
MPPRSGFGAGVMAAKPILKALPPMFDHKDKNVREKAKDITVRTRSTPLQTSVLDFCAPHVLYNTP